MQHVFATAVYLLCFLTSAACAFLLGRSYRQTKACLLLWSSLCFTFLALSNLLLVFDLLVLTDVDLRIARLLLSFLGVGTLLFGFIWDMEEA
ncbi:DUF5985 family protein [Sphingomonas sp. KRR8]|uniref:DUF5985 family protein n=1 Tax=Sphingomonas sp. KRR8 TaxID=2942996 RepID=UPI002020F00F|nr:DUF5985 family protein [Sphingomonas sp. KRR8]URD60085.1 DUF5985 family protein [Sphingomonas sp. KRR8]